MAITPFFITGAVAKVKLNGKTFAFCQDISCSIGVATESPRILGMYEPTSIEPVAYEVSGSFTLVRYIRGVKDFFTQHNMTPPVGVSEKGNGIGGWGDDSFLGQAGIGTDPRPNEHLNPRFLATSSLFDIEVYQKVRATDGATDEWGVVRIRGCRIERADFNLSKASPAMQSFTFKATYADEDSFNAGFSGLGHHF